jgi:hypothetical protein
MPIKMSSLDIVVQTCNTRTQKDSLGYLVRPFIPTMDRKGKQFYLR